VRPSPVRKVSSQAGDVLARLLLESRQDPRLRAQILFLRKLPPPQRESLVNSALAEIKLRGEPVEISSAFAVLATDKGARAASAELESVPSDQDQ
jgi:hypothetical protein